MLPMYWHIVDHQAPQAFASLNAVFTLHGEVVTQAKTRDLLRVENRGQIFFVKRYWTAGKRLRKYMFRSRAKAEWENLQYFNHLRVPAPHLVSYGESRRCFNYEGGAFVMHGLNDVLPLDALLSERRLSREMRLSLLQQIAQGLRTLHQHQFVHGDFFVRNFLVSIKDSKVYFTDCPRGRHMWGPFLAYGKVRDLASFYKGAQSVLSLADQLRFYLWYRGETRLTSEGKAMLMKVIKKSGTAL